MDVPITHEFVQDVVHAWTTKGCSAEPWRTVYKWRTYHPRGDEIQETYVLESQAWTRTTRSLQFRQSAQRSSTCSSPKGWITRGVCLNRGVWNVIRASGIVSACLFAVCIFVCCSSWRFGFNCFCVMSDFAFCIMTTAPPHTMSAWRQDARTETWTVCNRI